MNIKKIFLTMFCVPPRFSPLLFGVIEWLIIPDPPRCLLVLWRGPAKSPFIVPPFVAFTLAKAPGPGPGDLLEELGVFVVILCWFWLYVFVSICVCVFIVSNPFCVVEDTIGFKVTTKYIICASAIPDDDCNDSFLVLDCANNNRRRAASFEINRFLYSIPPCARTFSNVYNNKENKL